MSAYRLAAAVVGACLVVAGCSNPAQPPSAPTGFSVQAGDGQVVVNFSQDPNLTYWIFLAQASSITRQTYGQFPGARIVTPAAAPQVISSLTNGIEYSFLINATSGGGAGPSTSSLSTTPRPAGNSFNAGPQTNSANNNALAYGVLPAPSEPVLVMVGSGGSLFTSSVLPGGTLVDSSGNQRWVSQTSNVSSDLNGVAYNAFLARFAAVGAGGTIIYSSNGTTWNTAAAPATSSTLLAITSFGQAYVAVGVAGTIVTSNDGSNWTQRVSNTTADLLGVNYVNNVLIAVGRSGTVMYSPDSVTWAQVPVPATSDLYSYVFGRPSLASGAAYYIFGASGTILTSVQPNTAWSTVSQPATTNDLFAATLGSRLVAGGKGGAIIYSDDGVDWLLANNPSGSDVRAMLYAQGAYTAVGTGGTSLTSF